MAEQFEFRLIDGQAEPGELEADHLIAIVQSLKEVALKIARAETDAEAVGRPTKRTHRVANLTIGLVPGSTTVRVRRSDAPGGQLLVESADEAAFDARFQALVEAIAVDERASWITDTQASAAGKLRAALAEAAPTVEFRAGGRVRSRFATDETHRETWAVMPKDDEVAAVSFVGRLRAVDLDTHRLQVTDDAGTKVALPKVVDSEAAGRLLNQYVTVSGTPERDEKGALVKIHDASVEPAPPLPEGVRAGIADWVSLESAAAGFPGPRSRGIADVTEDEAEAFLAAIGL